MSNSNVILIVDMTQLDNDGNIVVKYMYDAWGNQKIVDRYNYYDFWYKDNFIFW